MRSRHVVMTGKNTVEFSDFSLPEQPDPGHLRIASQWSVISGGTELANYTGADAGVHRPGSWNAYPWNAGYGNVGVIEAIGSGVHGWSIGQRVFTFGPHATHFDYPIERMVAAVPAGVDPGLAAASRMAAVAMAGPMQVDFGYDRWVAVLGLGLVGNLAAQISRLLGARVIGIDPLSSRRALAECCGIEWTLGGSASEITTAIHARLGKGPDIVIDATGRSEACVQAVSLAAAYGQVIVLGTPRVPVQGDLTQVFAAIHSRWLTVSGALEWNLPHYPVLGRSSSLLAKQQRLFDWIERGELHLAELISHRFSPAHCRDAYEGLLRQPQQFNGVLFDWQAPNL
jgi:2-desacetyl-2-hydroxyethyl bacteriochlorophyllide A dehydrogenase